MPKRVIKKVLSHPLYKKHQEKVKFLMVGGVNTLIDFGIFGLLANVLGLPAVGANMISTAICIAVSFVLNYRFVWESKKSKLETAPRFVAMSLFTAWVIQSGIIWIFVSIFGDGGMMNLVAKVAGILVGMVVNYLGYRFIFR